MLEKYGVKANDAILAEEKHMGLYEDLIQNRNAKLIAGGAAQNTARGAQVLLLCLSLVPAGCGLKGFQLAVTIWCLLVNSTCSPTTPSYTSDALVKTSMARFSRRPAAKQVYALNTVWTRLSPLAAVV